MLIRACDVDGNSLACFRKPIAQGHAKYQVNKLMYMITKTGENEHDRDFLSCIRFTA